MYMQGFKCNVTGATSTVPLAVAKAPVMCEEDESKCVKGARQMIAWNREFVQHLPKLVANSKQRRMVTTSLRTFLSLQAIT